MPQVTLEGDGGTFGTGHGSGQLSGLLGKFDYSAAADYFSTDGQGPGDYFRDVTRPGNFGWKFSDTDSLRLTLRNNSSDAGPARARRCCRAGRPRSRRSDIHDFSANLAWNFSTGRALAESGVRHSSRDFFWWKTRRRSEAFTYGLQPRWRRIEQSTYLFKNGSFTAGYENEVEIWPVREPAQSGGVLEVRYQFGARLTAIVGGRVEANGFFGTRDGAARGSFLRAAATATDFWGATRLRASYGRGNQGARHSAARLQSATETGAEHDGGCGHRSVFRRRSCAVSRPHSFTMIFATS